MKLGNLIGSITFVNSPSKYEAKSLIELVNWELYEWDDINTWGEMHKEEYYRIQRLGDISRSLNRGNNIMRWLRDGSPSFEEYENNDRKQGGKNID